MGQRNVLIKIALVLVLALISSASAADKFKIKSMEVRSMQTPDFVGGRPLVKARNKRKKQQWFVLIVDYVSLSKKNSKGVTFKWKGYSKAGGGKYNIFSKSVSYGTVPFGPNYAAIFIDPSVMKKYFKSNDVKKVASMVEFQLIIEAGGSKQGIYFKKGKASKTGNKAIFKKKKGVQTVDVFLNKKESPFANIQIEEFNTISK